MVLKNSLRSQSNQGKQKKQSKTQSLSLTCQIFFDFFVFLFFFGLQQQPLTTQVPIIHITTQQQSQYHLFFARHPERLQSVSTETLDNKIKNEKNKHCH